MNDETNAQISSTIENPDYFTTFRARRAAKEASDSPAQPAPERAHVDIRKFVKIGRPGYKGR